jgi:hypothetical protein
MASTALATMRQGVVGSSGHTAADTAPTPTASVLWLTRTHRIARTAHDGTTVEEFKTGYPHKAA